MHRALRTDLDQVIETLDVDAAATLPELFVSTARPLFEYYCRRPKLSRELLGRSLFASGPQADVFRRQAGHVGELLVRRVTDLQASGAVAREASAEAIVLAFFSHYYFILISELADADIDAMLQKIRRLALQLEAGVAPRPPES